MKRRVLGSGRASGCAAAAGAPPASSAARLASLTPAPASSAASGVGAGGGVAGTLLPRPPTCVSWFLAELAAGQGGVEGIKAVLAEDAQAAAVPHPLIAAALDAWARQAERDTAVAAR